MQERYNAAAIEEKWQNRWDAEETFKVTEDPSREKFYLLEMFPYPSGRIHMGHVRNYSIAPSACRRKMPRSTTASIPPNGPSRTSPA